MKTDIKAVLFDYGNVLCLQHYQSDLDAMARCLGSDPVATTSAYWEYRDGFDRGTYHGREYWTKIANHCGISPTEQQLMQLIELDNIGWTRPNHVMVEWAKRLKSGGISTAIVSNMPQDIREYLRSVEWLPAFDHYSFSCELLSLKPEVKIYEHTLESMNIHPSHALFLDDREVNVNAAKALGMHGFVFSDHDSLQAYLSEANLPPLMLHVAASAS
jgi:putative hydrolase of the HAD superfamily